MGDSRAETRKGGKMLSNCFTEQHMDTRMFLVPNRDVTKEKNGGSPGEMPIPSIKQDFSMFPFKSYSTNENEPICISTDLSKTRPISVPRDYANPTLPYSFLLSVCCSIPLA